MLQAGTNYTSVLSGFDIFSNCTTETEGGCFGSSPCEDFFNTPIQVVCVPAKLTRALKCEMLGGAAKTNAHCAAISTGQRSKCSQLSIQWKLYLPQTS